jgi:glucose/arabinose dehydrogenase
MKIVWLAALLFAAGCSADSAETTRGPIVPPDFSIQPIARVPNARELAFAPDGDLFVGTGDAAIYLVRDAEGVARSGMFAKIDRGPAAGVALAGNTLYIGGQFGIFRIPYHAGDRTARALPVQIAAVRTSGVSSDHVTTSVAVAKDIPYASVGSSCNACQPELDSTRATIQMFVKGKLEPKAVHIRNAIALTTNVNTGTLWAGVAGSDDLPPQHPYEIFDAVGAHAGVADYGWPWCYENRKANPIPKWAGHDCSKTVIPRVIFPAYETPIGAVFYPVSAHGRYGFPLKYQGGAFVTLHGSWHGPPQGLRGYVPPRVAFVPMHGDLPARPVRWNDPGAQWTDFVTGYQIGGTISRLGRPSGIAVGPEGDLFVADDQTGTIYRIRPKNG